MSRQVRVGILVFAGLALFLVALFAIASRSFLFSTTFPLESEFENVAGLQAGAPVQYQGGSAGRVESVEFPSEMGGLFTVKMAIKDEVRNLVNERTVAQIQSQSLVGGGMMIVLKNPSREALAASGADPDDFEPIEPGGRVPGQEPFNIGETSDQLLATVDTFANVAVEAQQIMQDIQAGRGSAGRLIYDDALYNSLVATTQQTEATAAEAQQLMTDLSGSAERITGSLETTTGGFQQLIGKINRGEGTLGRLLNDEAAYNQFLAAADTLVASTQRIESVLANAESATQWGSLSAYRLAELMEALKHNFLFKGYFEERGYMEKADFEIRESAIEATYDDLEERIRELDEREQRLEQREASVGVEADEQPATSSAPGPSTDGVEDASEQNTSQRPASGEGASPALPAPASDERMNELLATPSVSSQAAPAPADSSLASDPDVQ